MDLTTETRKLKGWGCSKLTRRRELLRDKERRKMVGTRSISFARMMLKAGRKFKQRRVTSAGKNILFNILEDHGKKGTPPSWSLVANVITDGICSGWDFLMAHVRCFLICYPFGYNVGICHCYVCAICHVLHLSVGFIVRFLPESHVIPLNMYPGSLIQNSR